MRFSKLVATGVVAAVLLGQAVGGCSGSGEDGTIPASSTGPPAPDSGLALEFDTGVTAPGILLAQYSEMNPTRRASYDEFDLITHGGYFATSFPKRNVTKVGNSAEFHPYWSETTGMTTNKLSYCTYPFTITDYDRTPEVRYGWSDPPDDLHTVWIGLAHWQRDTWDWYRAEPDGVLSLPSFDPYISLGGEYLFIIVLHASTDVSSLRYIGLGPKQVTAVVRAAPKYSLLPTHATAGSAASTTVVGTIEKHEFDWDDDGIFEDDAGPVGASSHDVDTLGTYSVRVRVTNSYGESDTDEDTYSVIEPWQHTWGLTRPDMYYGLATDGTEYCYAAGSLTTEDSEYQVVLLKYSLAGAFQWARAWGSTYEDCAYAVACYQDKVFLAGYTENYGADGKDVLVQCWSTSGDLEWTRTWGGDDNDVGTGIALTPYAVYVCGEERVTSADRSNALLLRYTHGGDFIWAKSWDAGQDDSAQDVISYYDILGSVYRLYLTGYTEDSGGYRHVLYMGYADDGTLDVRRAWECNQASNVRGAAITLTGYPPTLYIAGQADDRSLLLEVGVATEAMAVAWGNDVYENSAQDLFIKGDHILVCGYAEWMMELINGYIIDISPTGGFNGYARWGSLGETEFHALAPFPGTGVLLGGFGLSADSSQWETDSESIVDRTGAWSTLTGTEWEPEGTESSPSHAGVAVTYGVKDAGAGDYSNDTALVAWGLP